MFSLEQIKDKLSNDNIDIRYEYLINNVSVGISWALQNKKIIRSKKKLNNLKKLYKEINNLPIPIYRKVNFLDQVTALEISSYALKIIDEIKN